MPTGGTPAAPGRGRANGGYASTSKPISLTIDWASR